MVRCWLLLNCDGPWYRGHEGIGTTDAVVVSAWIVHGHCLGHVKQILSPGSLPRDSGVVSLGCWLGPGSFESSHFRMIPTQPKSRNSAIDLSEVSEADRHLGVHRWGTALG